MKRYDYVFYKYYKLAKIMTNSQNPAINAILVTTVLQSLNIMFIMDIVNRFVFSLPQWLMHPSDTYVMIVAILIYVANIFLYSIGDRPKQIERKYSQETEKERKSGNIIVVTYSFLSVILVFILTIMNRK